MSRNREEEPQTQVYRSRSPNCGRRGHRSEHFDMLIDAWAYISTRHTQYWNQLEPKAIRDGQVTIQAHDFFTPQPVKDADIFLLRRLLHDWPNPKAIEILKQLREVAVSGRTRVVVIDAVIQYACEVDRKQIPGTDGIVFEGEGEGREVPAGLLSNLGKAKAMNYLLDLTCGPPPRRFLDCNFLTRLQDVGDS